MTLFAVAVAMSQMDLGGNGVWRRLPEHRGITDVITRHTDGHNLQGIRIDTNVQLTPLTAVFSAALFAFPLAFTQELDAYRVKQKTQVSLTASVQIWTLKSRCRLHRVLKSGTGQARPHICSTEFIKPVVCLSAKQNRLLSVKQN